MGTRGTLFAKGVRPRAGTRILRVPMPIYEYRCEKGHTFEVMQKMTDDPVTTCETHGTPVERVFHPVAVHFKGKGFYNTDYGTKRRNREAERSGSAGGGGRGAAAPGGAGGGSAGDRRAAAAATRRSRRAPGRVRDPDRTVAATPRRRRRRRRPLRRR